jgi:hypothetical protein
MFKAIALIPALFAFAATSSLAQNGPEHPQIDNSGKGAVLCLQEMLIATKAGVQACKWTRTPTDDVIDKALSDIAAFVVANSSRPVTREQIDKDAEDELRFYLDDATGEYASDYCPANPEDPVNKNKGGVLTWTIHTMAPATLSAMVADALSIPREPLLNPCL